MTLVSFQMPNSCGGLTLRPNCSRQAPASLSIDRGELGDGATSAAAGGRVCARRGGHRKEWQPEGRHEGAAERAAADPGSDAAPVAPEGRGRGRAGSGFAPWRQVRRSGPPVHAWRKHARNPGSQNIGCTETMSRLCSATCILQRDTQCMCGRQEEKEGQASAGGGSRQGEHQCGRHWRSLVRR